MLPGNIPENEVEIYNIPQGINEKYEPIGVVETKSMTWHCTKCERRQNQW